MINLDAIFDRFPVRTTSRLILREFTLSDYDQYLDMCSDPLYTSLFRGGNPMTGRDAFITLKFLFPKTYKERKDLTWAITLNEAPFTLVGLRDIFIDGANSPMITQGFIHRDWRNKGINQEVLQTTIDFLSEVGAQELRFTCNQYNDPVVHIAEKLGFDDLSKNFVSMNCNYRLHLPPNWS